MKPDTDISGYRYHSDSLNQSHRYLLPAVARILHANSSGKEGLRVFELGCGNGSVANHLATNGYRVTGVDASEEGIEIARRSYPNLDLHIGSAYDDLAMKFGRFPIVLSLEVIEHLYFPRRYAATLYSLLEDQGTAIISTPYHGYWKNLALAITGKMDGHFTVLWDHGHIKFWSMKTLTSLLREVGFREIDFARVGRIPPLAKSMIAIARR